MTPSPLLDDSSSRSAILSESFRQSEDFSQYTGSSSSTIWGPGALAGKALKACGELALRAWDDIKIRRRLSTLDAQFPDKPSFFILEDDPMYEDLLELSRYVSIADKREHEWLRQLCIVDLGCMTFASAGMLWRSFYDKWPQGTTMALFRS